MPPALSPVDAYRAARDASHWRLTAETAPQPLCPVCGKYLNLIIEGRLEVWVRAIRVDGPRQPTVAAGATYHFTTRHRKCDQVIEVALRPRQAPREALAEKDRAA